MKKDQNDIKDRIEKTLSAFDDVKKASPKPFFYSRLKARMENRESSNQMVAVLRPSMIRVMAAVVAFLLVINAFTVMQFMGSSEVASASGDEISQAFIEEYYPVTPTVYNLEITLNE